MTRGDTAARRVLRRADSLRESILLVGGAAAFSMGHLGHEEQAAELALREKQSGAQAVGQHPPPPPTPGGRPLPTHCLTPRLLAQRPQAARHARAGIIVI